MDDFLRVLVLMAWAVMTGWRVYRLARFYQIDEYKSNRFARWWFASRERVLPQRALGAAVVAAGAGIIFSEGGALLPGLIWLVAIAIGGYLRQPTEIKKKFVATQRAKRLLAASWIALALVFLAAAVILPALPLPDRAGFGLLAAGGVGLVLWLLSPVWLMLGNLVAWPVEESLRRLYVRRARAIVQRINPTVIGITGSYGKTTTKNFITELLNARYKAYATPKSYNTMMGVCRAINSDLADNYAIDYFIVEMGAYFPGEIARIAELTPPHIGIEIEVGPQHLERFKTLERTATAKYEVIASLPPDGVGIFNWDNPYIRAMQEKGYPATRIGVSRTVAPKSAPPEVRYVATDESESLAGLSFTVHDTHTGESQPFVVPVLGLHNVLNLLIAVAVCVQEGMTLKEIANRARTLKPAESRLVSQSTAEGITVLNDAYSANPVGSRSALHVLSLHTNGRRVLVTPGMIELGAVHDIENRKLGEAAAAVATDIILVGVEQTRPLAEGVRAANFPEDHLHIVEKLADALAWTRTTLQPGDAVLYLNDLPDTY
jgi:UDP-N-acetylmuramoyl-tripeptide--D-alanyl-D-alanine ligase